MTAISLLLIGSMAVTVVALASPDAQAVAPPAPAPAPTASDGFGAPPTSDHPYRVFLWNIAGSAMHRGATDDGLVDAVVRSLTDLHVDLAALNEVCVQQFDAIKRQLAARRWPENGGNFVRWAPTNPGGRDSSCQGRASGIAVISRAPLGSADVLALPADGRVEHRQLLCAPLEAVPRLRFCTTHITFLADQVGGQEINERQLAVVRKTIEGYESAGDTVITAGDFNAAPDYGRLDSWYAPSLDEPANSRNTGAYRELDDTDPRCPGYGETTSPRGNTDGPCGAGGKLDLMFVRGNRIVGAYDADSFDIPATCTLPGGRTGQPCSDHRSVLGSVTVSVVDTAAP